MMLFILISFCFSFSMYADINVIKFKGVRKKERKSFRESEDHDLSPAVINEFPVGSKYRTH
jgi:hypothetical protein